MTKDIRVPEIGENVESGEVVSVLVKRGDMVAVDDIIIELETEKATVEIPSPFEGRITEVLVKEGDPIKVGDVIARVDTEAGSAQPASKQERARPEKEETADQEDETSDPEDRADGPPEEAAESEEEQCRRRERPRHPEPAGPPKKASDDDFGSFAAIPASPSVRRLARELGVNLNFGSG